LIVLPTGETVIETQGFAGAACQEASRFLELALGAKTGERLTADYFRFVVPATGVLDQERGGL
jgi:hypothetical protein